MVAEMSSGEYYKTVTQEAKVKIQKSLQEDDTIIKLIPKSQQLKIVK